ncbi:hypothetical protein MLD38_002392 [Melastoma candidum]|uniref:Uncharacterized protein n=1 Tax=Melastoma candidum TaxID=119954 RepID=A0ACB9RYW8_9MYRT|nr:hypothetical protein MLD38_002392 [Melastoma candidum]
MGKEMDLEHPNESPQHPEGHPAAPVQTNTREQRKRSVQGGLLLFLCVAASSCDAFFFYIPMIDLYKKCLEIDRNIAITMVVLRTLVDLLHLAVWWVYNHKNAFCNARPEEEHGFEVFSKKEIVIEILSILPLSQAVTTAILLIQGSPKKPHAVLMLKFAVLLQYLIRALRIYPSYRSATVNSKTLRSNHVWFGAAFNLALYMIAAHVIS